MPGEQEIGGELPVNQHGDADGDSLTARFVTLLNEEVQRRERTLQRQFDRRQLARSMKLSPASLYAYLNGTTQPSGKTFDLILAELGIAGAPARKLTALRDKIEVSRRSKPRQPRAKAVAPSPVPDQLPMPNRAFTGRGPELEILDRLHAANGDDHRSPTIAIIDGTAGVGKTALAVHWAHQVKDTYADGRLYADLHGFADGAPADPAHVLDRFLLGLHVDATAIPADRNAKVDLYRSVLAGRRVLILLDNARSAEQVRPLLPTTSTAFTVVTSRNRLNGLMVREGAREVPLDVLPGPDAIQLIGFQIGRQRLEEEPEAVTALARACARLPLALSIAGVHLAAHPAVTVSHVVDELRTSARGLLDPLRTDEPDLDLRSVFDWSYDTLPGEAARLFRLLSHHPGPDIDADACAAVLGVDLAPRAELSKLESARLIEERRQGRFSFHDLLRTYAAELARRDDPARSGEAVERMLEHYLCAARAAHALIQPCARGVGSPATVAGSQLHSYSDAMSWFTNELDVLRSLITKAADTGFERYAWELTWACSVFLRRTGRRADREQLHLTALRATEQAGDRRARAITLRMLGDAVARMGRLEEAAALALSSLAESNLLEEVDQVRQTHLSLARIHASEGEYELALQHAEQALRHAEDGSDELAKADGFASLAMQNLHLLRHDEAGRFAARALSIYERIDHHEGQASVLKILGTADLRSGRLRQALEHHTRALALDRRLGDPYWEAHGLSQLADCHAELGEIEEAGQLRRQAIGLLRGLNHPDAEVIAGDPGLPPDLAREYPAGGPQTAAPKPSTAHPYSNRSIRT
ncbi:tetratricopeptide repeat protein [Amycolatopsis sp. NPDC051371]|uniref:ATP-binding protein n=1 Tax=Amycolatopsis sp. NPDC051371 TaxID=3155800 RepID=UPI0034283E4B